MNNLLLKSLDNAAPRFQAAFGVLLLALLLVGAPASAETTVEEIGSDDASVVSVEPIEPLSAEELGDLVGPIALYPDDLIAIVLPASTYPLQVVQAARFLEARKSDPSLKPSEDWDDSIVALLNYPEVVEMLNADLDWTGKLGEAVLVQQEDVIAAVSDFRERARVAGNLKSDEHQTVSVTDDGAIEIAPADPEVIYVPYYEPSRVVVYHDYPVYYYYPRGYPVYYYPYPAGYDFYGGYFWGVTSVFSIGWSTHHVHLHHYGYYGHPYYGHSYYDYYYYRRPHLSVSYNYYYDRYSRPGYRYHAGNYWRPRGEHYGASPRYRNRIAGHRDRHDGHRDRYDGHRDRYDGGRDRYDGGRDRYDGGGDAGYRQTDQVTRQRYAGDSRSGRTVPRRTDSQRQQLATGSGSTFTEAPRRARSAQLDGAKRANRNPARSAEAVPISRSRMAARDSTSRGSVPNTRMTARDVRMQTAGATRRADRVARADQGGGRRERTMASRANPIPGSRALAPQRAAGAAATRQPPARIAMQRQARGSMQRQPQVATQPRVRGNAMQPQARGSMQRQPQVAMQPRVRGNAMQPQARGSMQRQPQVAMQPQVRGNATPQPSRGQQPSRAQRGRGAEQRSAHASDNRGMSSRSFRSHQR